MINPSNFILHPSDFPRMGITKAAFFIRQTMSQKIDYLTLKDELFGGKSVDQVCKEIAKEQKTKDKGKRMKEV